MLDAFRELNHPAVGHPPAALSAWESLEAAGIPSAEILEVACGVTGYQAADTSGADGSLANLLPQPFAIRYGVVPLGHSAAGIEMATANPLAFHLERDLAFATGHKVRVSLASPTDIRAAQTRVYGERATLATGPRLRWLIARDRAGNVPTLPSSGSAVEALDWLITEAIDQRASDIHIEARDGEALVRFRVDGVLHDIRQVPRDVTPFLMSRIKIIAGVDIADRLRPKDGRAAIVFDDRTIDLRISSLPLGERNEKSVIRVLDIGNTNPDLSMLGFTKGEAHRVKRLLGASEGMLLLTGPTGSGKTTTLYSVLRSMQSSETNIVSIEDPVEYRLEGINQVQVNERAGLTFASALRSILRQDPDVVLVGEIRDRETADIAIKASMTGHVVLSTLHTNDAPSAINRLADIGVELAALGTALKGVVAQRLVRRLCEECAVPIKLDELPLQQQSLVSGKKLDHMRRPVGCPVCRGTGYRGRMVVAELLVVTDDLQRAIAGRASSASLLELARNGGMRSLWDAGLERVLAGSTSLHELVDNISIPLDAGVESAQSDIDALLAKLRGETGPTDGATPRPAMAGAVPPPPATARSADEDNTTAPRVLVAHEDRRWRRTMHELLAGAGCSVIEAGDGPTALEFARSLRPAVLLTDVVLPGMGATALLEAFAKEHVATKIVLYTEQADVQLHQWLMSLGISDLILAPRELGMVGSRVAAVAAMAAMAGGGAAGAHR
ncbi:MAG TPA: type II/IV secretion system protein [Gemmatimonadaceae bacterium]|nr:type II/IV secretion system protein [Gemmatimonadaceae bacterium]